VLIGEMRFVHMCAYKYMCTHVFMYVYMCMHVYLNTNDTDVCLYKFIYV
jgi:hypothetical protein